MIAPSGMMDGQVSAIRHTLDVTGFSHIPVMAYAAKFASVFYGPFRDAVDCKIGKNANVRSDRKSYQMDPANAREALRDALLDEREGADILMVKPGIAYLDILAKLRQQSELPLAVYQVSGEYAMLRFAAQAGALLASEPPRPLNIWLKLDSGMHRLGFEAADLRDWHGRLRASPQVAELNLLSHFACADERGHPLTELQVERFLELLDDIRAAGAQEDLVEAERRDAELPPQREVALFVVGLELRVADSGLHRARSSQSRSRIPPVSSRRGGP